MVTTEVQFDPWQCADCDQPSKYPVVVEAPSGQLMIYVCQQHFAQRMRPPSKFRIYFDDTPGRNSWTLDFPEGHQFGPDFGSGIAGMETYDEACQAFRAALAGVEALRAFLGPAWSETP